MQHIQMLPLVFMDALDLDVKQGFGVYRHPRAFDKQVGKLLFRRQFDLTPCLLKGRVNC